MLNELKSIVKLSIKFIFSKATYSERFNLMTKISRKVFPEYKFKWPQLDWWKDQEFEKHVIEFDGLESMNRDRRWMSFQLMRMVENIEGDTAECGVYKGATSKVILNMNTKSKYSKEHHIFDSFEGLSSPKDNDGIHWSKNDLSIGENIVTNNLNPYKDFRCYKGWIPNRFDEIKDKIFSFVHVDVDLYEPTKDSIEFFYNKLNKGGIFLCDDYGSSICPGATQAIDEFLVNKDEKMILLSGGSGFFIKGLAISSSKYYCS